MICGDLPATATQIKLAAKAVYDDFFDGVDAPNYRHLDMPL